MRLVRMIWVPVILGGAAIYLLSGTGSDLERGSDRSVSVRPPAPAPMTDIAQNESPATAVAETAEAPANLPSEGNTAPGLSFPDRLRDRLVVMGASGLGSFNDPAFASRRFYLLYFADASGPCVRLTTELAHAYKPGRSDRKYELILVSSDPTEAAMEQTMRQSRMPWPAIRFESRNQLARYAGPEVPCLVLVDRNGRVLSHTFQGKEMVGPGKVISDLERLLSTGL